MTWKKRLSQKLEGRLAKRVGGRLTPASGATPFLKGDVRAKRFLIEHKFTLNKKSYTVQVKELAAIEEKALKQGLTPALVFELPGIRMKYAIVPLHIVEELEHAD
jgi:hypothetical protein